MNETIFRALNGIAGLSPALDWFIVFFADRVLWVVVALMLIYALLRPHNRRERLATFVMVVVAGIVAWGVASFVKNMIPVERPFLALHDVKRLIVHGDYDSFPSGHTAFMFALATALSHHHKRWGIALLITAAFAGIARVVSGIHFPLDVIAGAALGIVVAYVFERILARYR